MEELEYITAKAMIQCTEGSVPGLFTPTYNATTKINSCLVSTKIDKISITNIPTFIVCKKTQKPCVPSSTEWQDTYPVKIKGAQTLIGKSCMNCGVGGKIEFLTSGQIPLSPEEEDELNGMRDDAQKAYDKEQEEKNKPWWKKAGEFVVDCVPIVGPIVSLVKNVSEGNWGMALLDVGFLALDVVGVAGAPFTGGASLAGSTVAKVGIKQAVKAGAKQVAKKLSKEALEAAAKQAAKQIEKLSLKSLTRGKLCVFACFPAGTPVAVKDDLKNIEDIKPEEEIWAWSENTGEYALKKVSRIIESETDVLVRLNIGGEIIDTTPTHPFYSDGEWVDAGALEAGDKVMLFSNKEETVINVDYVIENSNSETSISSKKTKVYNFEVEDFETFHVGNIKVLVHNGAKGMCIKETIKKVSKRLQYLGRTPGKNSKTGREVFERMKSEVPPTARELPNGQKIFKDSKGDWHDISKADMAHQTDAVSWWNKTGRNYGAKSKEVRDWMLNSKNYKLDHYSINRSQGAQIGETYLNPLKK
ncbi:polymorphic toxin-type HINT domain-containing protein [Pedobacter mendelii]|uniref:Hint domain-containing protein n=1 Tax=Pedobacter mendelii TaxID=1908240 RepID=A0ABQ2BL04_9SPHI|nr:polymorphic toxin-type HINT domain-containing protein [Pedobacter mendelii]GGI28371.1 hypothetical protein GCM10008119_32320 [Pedobacter mendelii]